MSLTGATQQHQRILLVDDDVHIVEALKRRLGQLPAHPLVTAATSAKEALHISKQCPFDLIISDLRMPEMDGISLLKQMRRSQPLAIRTILSGQANTEQVMTALPIAHGYLEKPCPSAEIGRLLSGAQTISCLQLPPALLRTLMSLTALPSDIDGIRESRANLKERATSGAEQSRLLPFDLGLQIATYRSHAIADGRGNKRKPLHSGDISDTVLDLLIQYGLLAPIREDKELLSALRCLSIKTELLRRNLLSLSQFANPELIAMTAYQGELALLAAVGGDPRTIGRFLSYRLQASSLFSILWDLPQSNTSPAVLELQKKIDSIFDYQAASEQSPDDLLNLLQEVICSNNL